MIDLSTIKQTLLDSEYFEDNNYLIFYLEVIKNNINTKRQRCKTNRHHIIPQCYFKIKKLEIDNSEDNLVNLLYKDHILAHYYLCLCCSNHALRYKLELSLQYMLDTYKVDNEFVISIKQLDEYQKLYEERKEYFSNIQKGQKGTSLGKIAIKKGVNQKFIDPENIDKYIKDGWVRGAIYRIKRENYKNPMLGKHHSDETKKKMAQKRIGNIPYNKGKKGIKWTPEHKDKQSKLISQLKTIHFNESIEKRVPKEQVEEWLNLGWKIGRCKKSVLNTSKNHAQPIYCVETNKQYNSFRDLCRELNLKRNCKLLKQHLNNDKNNYCGYHFKSV